jgi:hypothetical protein
MDSCLQVLLSIPSIGSSEHGPDVSFYFRSHTLFEHIGTSILLQVVVTSLPGNTAQNSAACRSKPLMVITNHQLHAFHATLLLALQSLSCSLSSTDTPKNLIFTFS